MNKEVELGEKGRVVIPLEIRRALEVEPGDKIMFFERDGEFILTTRRALVQRLSGIFATNDGRDWTQELLDERRAEAAKKWS